MDALDERYAIDFTTRPGRGGFATVYRAQDRKLDREVALKLLDSDRATDEQEQALFLKEVSRHAKLRHPNIVTLYDGDVSDGQPFYTMEWIHGRTLADVVGDDGPLPFARVTDLVRSLSDAIDYLHSQGIAHQDIHMRNVMLEDDDRIVLMDFGIARNVTHHSYPPHISLLAAAPEQLDGLPGTFASDIYALGTLTYWMLAGQRPPLGASVRDVVPGLGASAYDAISAALSSEPAERPATAKDFSNQLASTESPSISEVIDNFELSVATMTTVFENAIGSTARYLIASKSLVPALTYNVLPFLILLLSYQLYSSDNIYRTVCAGILMCIGVAAPTAIMYGLMRRFYGQAYGTRYPRGDSIEGIPFIVTAAALSPVILLMLHRAEYINNIVSFSILFILLLDVLAVYSDNKMARKFILPASLMQAPMIIASLFVVRLLTDDFSSYRSAYNTLIDWWSFIIRTSIDIYGQFAPW